MRGTLLLVGGLLLASGLTVAGWIAAATSTGPAGDVVATTTNFRIQMPTTLRAGPHTFAYTNGGSVPHELLLFRTDLTANALPLRGDGNVDEESPVLRKVLDSGNATASNRSESVTTNASLGPGHYVAVCNLPGHYHLGMRLNVTVVP